MQIPPNIQLLIEKYQSGTATEEELRQLNAWYHSFDDTEVEVRSEVNDTEQHLNDRIKTRLLHTIQREKPLVRSAWRWRVPAVAAAALVIAAGVYFLSNSRPSSSKVAAGPITTHSEQTEIKPGGNKAILTLANGSSIVLDTTSNGMVGDWGNVKIQKLENGLLAYSVSGKEEVSENDATNYNIITTPRGGQYQVSLTDGTKVWLNASSSIRFPLVFRGKERKVQITGEAYFEVAKNKSLPFRVEAAGSEIEVLGTHFNVNAYTDEVSVKTTLLEGSVKVSSSTAKDQSAKFIEPGQQASVNKDGAIDIKDHADVEEAVAWKNGRFQFKSTDIRSILRQLSRWYDVNVVYQGNVNLHFTGQLSRTEAVDTIFKKLELTGAVHFKTEGKTIIVSP